MSIQLLSAFADIGAVELSSILEGELARRGLPIVERMVHPDGKVFPELSERLARYPGGYAFTFHEPPPLAVAPPTTILAQRFANLGRWDPTLVRALSAASGGWAVAVESVRTREEYGLAIFLAGRTVEAIGWDYDHSPSRPGPPGPAVPFRDELAWMAFLQHYRAITRGHDRDLRSSEVVTSQSWIVAPDPIDSKIVPYRWDASAESPLGRAMFGLVEAARFKTALTGLDLDRRRLRFIQRLTPTAAVPYVLLEGDLDQELVVTIARRLDTFAAAVVLRSADDEYVWTDVKAGGAVHMGTARGAETLERVVGSLSLCMGESPAIFRWPSQHAGERAGQAP